MDMRPRVEPPGTANALREEIRRLAWQHALIKAGLPPTGPPSSPFDPEHLDGSEQATAVLAMLRALRNIQETAEQLIHITVTVAGDTGASGPAIGEALDITGAAVRKRWPGAVEHKPGPRRLDDDPHRQAERHHDWVSNPGD